ESLGLPMAKGSLRAKALAPVAASARPGHLRVGSRFVDEDQPVRLGPHLGLSFSLPRLARLAHVGPIAFAGPKAFFKSSGRCGSASATAKRGRLSPRWRLGVRWPAPAC